MYMEEIIEKIEKLKEVLNEQECIKKLKELNPKILEDKELLSLIEKYRYTKEDKIREQIIQNELYKEYCHYEYELNMIILMINSKLKEISKGSGCGR